MKTIIWILFFTFLYAVKLSACSCFGQSSVKTSIKKSNLVFVGQVTHKEEITVQLDLIYTSINQHFNRFTFVVKRVYKGKVKTKTIQVVTGVGSGDCGIKFEVGKEYIVYSKWRNRHSEIAEKVKRFLHTDICTRTTSKFLAEEAKIKRRCKHID